MSSSPEPPSADAEETTEAWSATCSFTDSDQSATSSQSRTSSQSNLPPVWSTFERDLTKYGIEFRPLWNDRRGEDIAKVANLRRFDLQLEPIGDCPLYIKKTDAELETIAKCGRSIINTHANKATCASWISKLLPGTSTDMPMFCCNSEFLRPGTIPEAKAEAPWPQMKPDCAWFYTPNMFDPSAWNALRNTLKDDFSKRGFGTIALNAEHKADGKSIKTAQLQGVAAAMVGLEERRMIQQTAKEENDWTNVDELTQYFFIFEPKDIQLWRLTKRGIHQFEAWQLDLGGNISFSAVDEIKRFIDVWNRLISNLAGPVLDSLLADLNKIPDTSNYNTHTTKKRTACENETVKANKVMRGSSRQSEVRRKRA
ncbi:MAG: hypothetical protein M1836_004131 [Candelina mexicana]|nr:MAG: hypothetical protein M1836_004131 [Candelina mexicana]